MKFQGKPEIKEERNRAGLSLRMRVVQFLGRVKYFSCFPLAAAAIP
jgi:hypothetical protein